MVGLEALHLSLVRVSKVGAIVVVPRTASHQCCQDLAEGRKGRGEVGGGHKGREGIGRRRRG